MTCVVVSGRLSAADMGRLEHACAPALLHHPSPLELDLKGVTSADDTARAMVARMRARGARVISGEWPPAGREQD